MKKIWITFITLLLSLALCAGVCSCTTAETATISVTVNGEEQTSGETVNVKVGTAYTVAATSSNEAEVSVSYVFGGNTKAFTGKSFTPESEGNYEFTFTAEGAENFTLTFAATKQTVVVQQYKVEFALGEHAATDAEAILARMVAEGQEITLPAAPKAESGYKFLGWNDGTKTYGEGKPYTVNGNVTLTALWTQQCTVTYAVGLNPAQGVSAPSAVTVDKNTKIKLESPLEAASGYVFTYWSDGTDTFTAGTDYTVKDDVTLTALYEDISTVSEVSVSFALGEHANADATVPATKTVAPGTTITLPDAPEAAVGYEFNGWKIGNNSYDEKASYQANATLTLTADWKKDASLWQGGLLNGNFETGTLDGWTTVSGEGAEIVNAKTYWTDNAGFNDMENQPVQKYLQTGEYFLITNNGGDAALAVVKSAPFQLGGDGLITFKMGAAANESCYVALCDADNDNELIKITNEYFKDPELSLVLLRRVMYANDYIGRDVYIKAVDGATGGCGLITFDDLKVSLTIGEVQAIVSAEKAEMATYRSDVIESNASMGDKAKAIVNAIRDYYSDLELIDINNLYWVQKIGDKAEYNGVKNINDYLTEARVSILNVAPDALVKTIVKINDGSSGDISTGLTSYNLQANKTYTVTYRISLPSDSTKYLEETFTITVSSENEIINGNFETGDLTGWEVVSGTAFDNVNVFGETTYWGSKNYNQEGKYHLDGWRGADEPGKGVLRSSIFKLGGNGMISFRLGGNKVQEANVETLGEAYISVKRENGTEVARFNNIKQDAAIGEAYMYVYVADLTTKGVNIGDKLYIELVDNATGDWGLLFVDDIKTCHTDDTIAALGTNGTDWFDAGYGYKVVPQ